MFYIIVISTNENVLKSFKDLSKDSITNCLIIFTNNLIVNENGGEFYKVKRFLPKQNEILYQLDLKVDLVYLFL